MTDIPSVATKTTDAQTAVPRLPTEIWAMIYEEFSRLPHRDWPESLPHMKSMLDFRLVSRCHRSAAWPAFGRTLFSTKHFRYCPCCLVKDRGSLSHPILSRYLRHVVIELFEHCPVCSVERHEHWERDPPCILNVSSCHCLGAKYSTWNPPTTDDLDDSKMDPGEVLRQVDLILGLPQLEHVKFEPDDLFREHFPDLVKDVITSIATWKSPAGQAERTLTVDLTGGFPCPVPAVPPSDQLANISTLNLEFDMTADSDPTYFRLFEMAAAFPNLAKLTLKCMHFLPTRSELQRFYRRLKGRQESLKELHIHSLVGLSIAAPNELVLLIGIFPNLNTLCLGAPIVWDEGYPNAWRDVFEGVASVSKLSRVLVDVDQLWEGEDILADVGVAVQFPPRRIFEHLGITPYIWTRGPNAEVVDDDIMDDDVIASIAAVDD
jgi:hypothetical protein